MGYKELVTFALSTSIVVGCSGSRVEAGKTDEIANLVSTPTPSQNNLGIENNLYLGTPGAIETQMVSTATAANLEKSPENELVSQKAVSSSVSVAVFSDVGLVEASGNLAYLFGYPVILTSGHVHDYVENKGATVQRLSIKRLNISNPISLSFLGYKEAHIFDDTGTDIGVFVITDPSEIKNLTEEISIDQMLHIEDLRFDPIAIGEPVTGMCYPSITYPYPYLFGGSVHGVWNSQFIIDNALTSPRCSGGGLFDSNNKYFALVSGGYDFKQFKDVGQDRWDDTFVTPLSSIGESGLELLINQAVSK